MYMGLMMLGRLKYRQQSDWCLSPVTLEVEMAIEKLKRYKSPGIDQIPAELIKTGGRTILRSRNSLILFGIKRNCLSSGRSQSLYLFIRRVIK
jgi:hypothetical protein